MVLLYSEKNHKKTAGGCRQFRVQELDYQGLGIAKQDGKIWFIENALPSEIVEAKVIEEKRQYGQAQAVRWLKTSANRQSPFCPHYRQCGGCQMQHIPITQQRQTKQKTLLKRLQALQEYAIELSPMIMGADKGYRRRAKFSIAWQGKQMVIGFRRRHSNEIIPLKRCDILTPPLTELFGALSRCLQDWKQKKQLGHLELVEADNGIALLLRHLGRLDPTDQQRLLDFAETHKLMLFIMDDKGEIHQLRGRQPYYRLQDLTLFFSIRDFIQINAELNRIMVDTAIQWLALSKQDRLLDLFCGMGNFSLPMANTVAETVGIEGVAEMVEQAQKNAIFNGIKNARFYQTDLASPFKEQAWAALPFNKVLLDPARSGALFALEHLCELQPERILYVSCNPATLVRDAQKLTASGYILQKCAMIDMFPHTAHLESISLFVKNEK